MPFSSLIVLSPQKVINKPTYPLDMHRNKWTYNHDGVITHLELDILECEVKWALGSISINKASGGNGIPAELFQILKYVKML